VGGFLAGRRIFRNALKSCNFGGKQVMAKKKAETKASGGEIKLQP
jgi:hypothetical protein